VKCNQWLLLVDLLVAVKGEGVVCALFLFKVPVVRGVLTRMLRCLFMAEGVCFTRTGLCHPVLDWVIVSRAAVVIFWPLLVVILSCDCLCEAWCCSGGTAVATGSLIALFLYRGFCVSLWCIAVSACAKGWS
jgi:hypothetical protein